MINLSNLISQTREEGYVGINAEAKVCQDIILKGISESSLNRHITVKGGVVMRSITGDTRRATVDIDLDFIKYSLEENSIRKFIDTINVVEGVKIESVGEIEELSQQEYKGKRVYIRITDREGNQISSKMDLGVHVNMDIAQEKYCFDICVDDEGVSLLINSKEQIFTEKLRSLLRFGMFSTRYKDVFDMYYLSSLVDKERLMQCIDIYIIKDTEMKENSIDEICNRVESTFCSRLYRDNITRTKKSNWLNINVKDVLDNLLKYLRALNYK